MKWLTLERIKQQCRIEPDFTMEDELLTSYGESAESTTLNTLGRTYLDLKDEYGEIPQDIINASLMLVDVWYQHRSPLEVVSLSLVPYTSDLLVKPYMRLAGSAGGGYQSVIMGSDVKIQFTADLPDGLKLSDIDFTGKVQNVDDTTHVYDFTKEDCIMVGDGSDYALLIDTETLGVGIYTMRLTVYIPDTDYPSGTRKEIININPHLRVTA